MSKTDILFGKGYSFLKKNCYAYLIPMLIGAITFIIIYGFSPLNVTSDNWLMTGYDEADIIQHYAGWLAFRNSDWAFPLGMAKNMAVGTGTIISFTDSIPIVAIFFKLFRDILPETFQYFGIFTFACYILQSIAAFKIIHLKTNNRVYSAIGTILFSFAPIFMERSFRHTALGAQWLVLFSIYLYLQYKGNKKKMTWVWFLILEVLAIGIHPYFLPMIACFAFLCMIEDIKEKRWVSILYLLGIQACTYSFGCIIGVLGSGVGSSRGGYGHYSMNINAILNPTSCGQYTWSSLMKIHPQILGNYDGFNYLGFGIVVFILLVLFLTIQNGVYKMLLDLVKRNLFLICACCLLTFFAISNVVTFNDKTLFIVPLPDLILRICGIFRASSRLFYPVYYVIYIFLIIILWRIYSKGEIKIVYGILTAIVFIQIFDISGCIIEKHVAMREKSKYEDPFDDTNLIAIAQDSEAVLIDNYSGNSLSLSVWAFKNDLKTYHSVANSGSYDTSYALAAALETKAKGDGTIDKNIVITSNQDVAQQYIQFENIGAYKLGDMYFIFDKYNCDGFNINETPTEVVFGIQLSSLSDENWTNGVSNDKRTLLFPFSTSVLKQVLYGTTIQCGDNSFNIQNVDFDDAWIRVTVDHEADVCAYPSEILVN